MQFSLIFFFFTSKVRPEDSNSMSLGELTNRFYLLRSLHQELGKRFWEQLVEMCEAVVILARNDLKVFAQRKTNIFQFSNRWKTCNFPLHLFEGGEGGRKEVL